jgi:Recombination endonuclease VII
MTKWRRKNPEKYRKYWREYYRKHKKKIIQRSSSWRKKNSSRFKVHQRKSALNKLGWTPEQYQKATKAQKNKCKICRKPNNQKGRPLHADHAHDSGKRRDLLCSGCNTGIGSFRDNPKLLEKAAEYLRRHGKQCQVLQQTMNAIYVQKNSSSD